MQTPQKAISVPHQRPMPTDGAAKLRKFLELLAGKLQKAQRAHWQKVTEEENEEEEEGGGRGGKFRQEEDEEEGAPYLASTISTANLLQKEEGAQRAPKPMPNSIACGGMC